VLLGLLAVAALPVAVEVAREASSLELVDAAYAIPVAAVLGIASIVLARSARRRVQRTIGRVGGERLAAVGRVLGLLGLCLAVAGAVAIGVYEVLSRLQ
jgi:hypothetical protein